MLSNRDLTWQARRERNKDLMREAEKDRLIRLAVRWNPMEG